MRPPFFRLLQTTALSIATILGTGILGLPVSIHASGLPPFLLTFTFNVIAQIGIVIAASELLQRAHHAAPPLPSSYQPVDTNPGTPTSPLAPPAPSPPSLHSLSEHFLHHRTLRVVFNFMVVSHFLFVLAAYSLAGPQALVSLIPPLQNVPMRALSAIFVLLCATAVLLFAHAILPSLTAATILKSTLLTFLVVIIFIRGLAIRQPTSQDWHPRVLLDPFLMGTFALNGVANLMPVTFQTCLEGTKSDDGVIPPIDRAFIRSYRLATVIAVFICYVLNILWCIAILMCVPQTDAAAAAAAAAAAVTGNAAAQPLSRTVASVLIDGWRLVRDTTGNSRSSLEAASQLGQISTIPLIEELRAKGDRTDSVIAILVNIFIALSITISFTITCISLKHYIDGEARAQSSANSRFSFDFNRRSKYLVYFSFVLVTAVSDPTALLKIMEGATSLSINIECGLFLVYMLYVGRKLPKEIPSPLSSSHAAVITAFVAIYFATAVFVDIVFYIPASLT